MKYTENKKIEPEGKGLYSKILKSRGFYLVAGTLTCLAFSISGLNFLITNVLLSQGFSQEEIEQNLDPKKNSLITKTVLQNPISKSGRDLAYYLNKK